MTLVVRRFCNSSKIVFDRWCYGSVKINQLSSFRPAQLHVLSRSVLEQSRKMEQIGIVTPPPNFFFKQVRQDNIL